MDPGQVSRLEADALLRDALAAQGFTGPAYGMFEEELVKYGRAVMMGLLISGEIFARCRRRGIGLAGRSLSPQDREELAEETVARALPVFRRSALVEGGWRPERGADLRSYFAGALLPHFANAYREWWSGQEKDADCYGDVPDGVPSPDLGPEQIVMLREEVRAGLATVDSGMTRAVLVLNEDGFDQDEIAEILGVTARSVEGLLYRSRVKIKARRGRRGRRGGGHV
jgi:DNA-directed RNA polymerase specialized sigma24 family protein